MKTNVKNLNVSNTMNAKLIDLNEQELRDVNGGQIIFTYVMKDGKLTLIIEKRS